jgi:hypothetical protein
MKIKDFQCSNKFEQMKKIIFLVFVVLFISGCAIVEKKENKTSEIQPLTQELCKSAGGYWNECGSACRGAPPGTMCIQVCVEYCECSGTEECPEGYMCTEYVDYTGICKVPK